MQFSAVLAEKLLPFVTLFGAWYSKLLRPFHRISTADVQARVSKCTYIPYTEHLPLMEEFTPEESEERLYELVSEYLERENLQGLPASQRSLMTWS